MIIDRDGVQTMNGMLCSNSMIYKYLVTFDLDTLAALGLERVFSETHKKAMPFLVNLRALLYFKYM